jgi:hypothetical protein
MKSINSPVARLAECSHYDVPYVCVFNAKRRNGEREKLLARTLKGAAGNFNFLNEIFTIVDKEFHLQCIHVGKSKFLNAKLIVNSIFVFDSATERNTKLQGNIMQNGIMI